MQLLRTLGFLVCGGMLYRIHAQDWTQHAHAARYISGRDAAHKNAPTTGGLIALPVGASIDAVKQVRNVSICRIPARRRYTLRLKPPSKIRAETSNPCLSSHNYVLPPPTSNHVKDMSTPQRQHLRGIEQTVPAKIIDFRVCGQPWVDVCTAWFT